MINPKLINPWALQFLDRARGTKVYRAGFEFQNGYSKFSRRTHRTHTDAQKYAERVKVRWCRLYDAAVLEMAKVAISTGYTSL